MKKILFIRTYTYHRNFSVVPPLGLMYLASSVRKNFGSSKYVMKIVDMKLTKMSIEEINKHIHNFSPDILACSVCSNEDRCLHEIAALLKRINEKCKVIIGGPHATMYYEDILKDNSIDIAVIGEGEETFSDLLKSFEDNRELRDIPGIAFKKNKELMVTAPRAPIENLDSLAFPAWDLIDIDRYSSIKAISMNAILAGKKYMGIFTSRGCPYHCVYCHNIFGKHFRKRTAENVIAEIKELYYRYKVDEFHVFDDVFNLDLERAKKICDLLISSGMNIKIAFPNGLRGDIMDEELLVKLKKSGTYAITYALESASLRMQKMLKKNIDIAKLKKIIAFSDKQGLLTKCYFMFGFPTETLEEIKQTIKFACNSSLLFSSFFIVTPQRKTDLFKLVKEFYPNYEINFNSYYYYSGDSDYEKLLGLPLRKLQKISYRKFYLNPRRLIRLFFRMPQKKFLLRYIPVFFSNIF